jgi:hypothetical protein
MKKAIILIAGLTGMTIAATAQKLATSKVPAAVKASFAKVHPNVKAVTWEKEKIDYEAGFEISGKEMSENYSAAGILLESETEIKAADLPKEVIAYVSSHYKGTKIKEAAKITKAGGLVIYEAEVNGKDLMFDPKGNPVK